MPQWEILLRNVLRSQPKSTDHPEAVSKPQLTLPEKQTQKRRRTIYNFTITMKFKQKSRRVRRCRKFCINPKDMSIPSGGILQRYRARRITYESPGKWIRHIGWQKYEKYNKKSSARCRMPTSFVVSKLSCVVRCFWTTRPQIVTSCWSSRQIDLTSTPLYLRHWLKYLRNILIYQGAPKFSRHQFGEWIGFQKIKWTRH
jgi:hypothetical protein